MRNVAPVTVPLLIAVATMLSRVPFRSRQIFHGDSLGLCCGALFTWTAHPPGFIGYCTLGRLVNFLLDDINLSFVVVNIVAIGLATGCVFALGRAMFGPLQGLVAATFFGTSTATFYFSEVALSYAAEGFWATAFALASWTALRRNSWGWVMAATIILALGGSVRQTTLAFLFPLWCYVLAVVCRGWLARLSAAGILIAVVAAWQIPSAHQLRQHWEHEERGFLESIYNLQIVMKQHYDWGALAGEVAYHEPERRFHWPFVELGVAAWNAVWPPGPDAPAEVRQASLAHAGRQILFQVLKVGIYLLLALGPAAAFGLLPLLSRRCRYLFTNVPRAAPFLSLWIAPAALFFAVGHFGSWGYLLVFLGAFCLIAAEALVGFVERRVSRPRYWVFSLTAAAAVSNLAFFLVARPLPETSERNRVVNVVLLQYTAPAIAQHYARARGTMHDADPRQLKLDCVQDDCLRRDLPALFNLDPGLEPMMPLFRRAGGRPDQSK
jgi:4-amino-4-deoxy-L-arabinose transferase-like glycosyltransferase